MDSQDDIFLNAREIADPAERAAYLAQACGDDESLRNHIEAMLRDANGAQEFFADHENLPGMVAGPLAEGPGTVIGRYKLLQKIGEGGMGVVYMAEQREPVVRKVALKIIKQGMDTRQVLGRFEAERQALALMDHPDIAKILDGGATDTGRPYFVMDLVQGLPITRFCDEANLSTRDRLDLFLDVCSAIQHAHQKGIIHRDLKPANILVTLHGHKPVPKVIDFGIAKATQGRLTDKTLFTQFQHFIGTPAYMSPEQASLSDLDVDTRSDIYGLGVLLYELLTGRTPFPEKELMASGLDVMRKTIREKEPVRPSTRLTQALVAGEVRRKTSRDAEESASSRRRLQELVRQLKGDLDWIVMKCLEKDRTRRYETANGLAADLKRYLSNEPVVARPPSQLYRIQKLARRNRLAFAAVVAITAVLVLAVVVSTWQAVRATRAEQEQSRLRESEAKQRQQAEANERKAQAAQVKETQLRLQSERRVYAADMRLVQRALEMNNIGSALNLLNRYRPTNESEIDFRGWEWRYLWNQCQQSDAESIFCRTPSSIRSLSVSHDGAWLATGLNQTGVVIWDLATGQEITRLPGGGEIVYVAFSPKELLLAYSDVPNYGSSRTNHSVHLWDGVNRREVRTLPLSDKPYGVAFSNDGRILVTSTRNLEGANPLFPGFITLWRVSDGSMVTNYPVRQYGTGEGAPFALAGDLSIAAHLSENDKICVIDLATGQERWRRKATDDYLMSLALSPDGKILASGEGYSESVIRLWEVASGREFGRLEGHRAGILHLIFWPDGKTLILGYLFLLSLFRNYPLGPALAAALLAAACLRLNHRFLRAEGGSLARIGLDCAGWRLAQFGTAFLAGSPLVICWMLIAVGLSSTRLELAAGVDRSALPGLALFYFFNNAAEELAYRGFAFLALEQAYGRRWAITGTSLAFTILHVQGGMPWPEAVAGTLTNALIFGVIFDRWKSLPLTLGFHLATNMVQDVCGLRSSALTLVAWKEVDLSGGRGSGILLLVGGVNIALAGFLARWRPQGESQQP